LGFLIVDYVAKQNEVAVKRKLCSALVGESSDHGEKFLFVKPQTYMNRSGEPVKELLRRFHATADDVVVVYDDLDLPFGRIRIRPKGSAGGHRGVLSVMEELAGASFYRVRVGIGRPPQGVDPVDYVLQPFEAEETAALGGVISRAAEAVMSLLREGSQPAMERFNRAP
jgi:PTH1 family peptidyl-tRNA hydrolase